MPVRYAMKAFVIGILMVVLLIPLGMINATIKDRTSYRQEAVAKIADSFAGPQVIAGPVLVVPWIETRHEMVLDAAGKNVETENRSTGQWLYYPKTLAFDGKLQPSERSLGLHRVRVYELQSVSDSHFELTLPPAPTDAVRSLGQPYLSYAIADVRGLVGTPALAVDKAAVPLRQGVGGHRGGRGLHAFLPGPNPEHGALLRFDARFTSSLGGTESLQVVPIADSNHIALASSWPHPQFSGRFLPRTRDIGAQGFRAAWDISSLASSAQAQYAKEGDEPIEALQVGLVDPVNVYSQADRASKYGVLFVLLTFVGFLMFELVKRLPIHPIQYGLVGLALAIFFLLLLSLSEHMEFWIAYLLAAAACISLQGMYLSAVLKSHARGWSFAGALTLLYAALYGLLVSEDNALVLGSLMLFAILAAIMLATRRIDWYAPMAESKGPPPIPNAG
jgi:inner membrane protein